MYAIVNFRRVTPVYVLAVWSLSVPPHVHFFLCLLSKNKLLTRDNLEKRRRVDDKTCMFCSEAESIHNLFFECIIASQVWLSVSEVVGFEIGTDFEYVAKRWICNKLLTQDKTNQLAVAMRIFHVFDNCKRFDDLIIFIYIS
jgi:hypothetical protein